MSKSKSIQGVSVARSIALNFTVSVLQREESVEKGVFVFVVAIMITTLLEFIKRKELQIIGIRDISLEFQPMCLVENALVRNHHVTKTIVSVLELECPVVKSVNAWIVETVNLINMVTKWVEGLVWRSNSTNCRCPQLHDINILYFISRYSLFLSESYAIRKKIKVTSFFSVIFNAEAFLFRTKMNVHLK